MAKQSATAVLVEEHRSIQRVLAALVSLADRLDTGKQAKTEDLQDVVAFMRMVNQGHERKEEICLFPALQRRDISVHSVPSRVLIEEHKRGRELVAKLEESAAAYAKGNADAREPLVTSLRGLAALYPLHVWQEDLLLFHQAEGRLTPEDDAELLKGFEELERPLGGDVHHRLIDLADKIQREAW